MLNGKARHEGYRYLETGKEEEEVKAENATQRYVSCAPVPHRRTTAYQESPSAVEMVAV